MLKIRQGLVTQKCRGGAHAPRGHREGVAGKEGGEIQHSNPRRDDATGVGIARKPRGAARASVPEALHTANVCN